MQDDPDDCPLPDALLDFVDFDGAKGIALPALGDDPDEDADAFVPAPHEVHCSDWGDEEAEWAEAAARSLAHNGFCVLRSPSLVPATACDACSADAAERLDRLFECARSLGLRPRRDLLRFSEMCSRTPGGLRFDQRWWSAAHGAGADWTDSAEAIPGCWVELCKAVERWVRPVLSRLPATEGMPRVDSLGCVTSLTGAPDQHFHPDGTARGLVNVFCPLVPIGLENGPTELRPGSHVWRETALGSSPRWSERSAPAVMPLLPDVGGALLLFDYRLYHRGCANHSPHPRPVAYVAFSTRTGVTDAHNFPSDSLLAAADRRRRTANAEE